MLEFILFAFLQHSNGLREHVGWYTERDRAKCIFVARMGNLSLPHQPGVIGREYYLCRCYSCGEGKF